MTVPLHFHSVHYAAVQPGPRLIVLGAVHGNEVCGRLGILRVIDDLNSGRTRLLSGSVTFVPVTNPLAYNKVQRAGDRNLNRNLAPTDAPQEFEDHIANWLSGCARSWLRMMCCWICIRFWRRACRLPLWGRAITTARWNRLPLPSKSRRWRCGWG